MPVNVSEVLETGSEAVKEMTRLMEYSVGEIMMNVNSLKVLKLRTSVG